MSTLTHLHCCEKKCRAISGWPLETLTPIKIPEQIVEWGEEVKNKMEKQTWLLQLGVGPPSIGTFYKHLLSYFVFCNWIFYLYTYETSVILNGF